MNWFFVDIVDRRNLKTVLHCRLKKQGQCLKKGQNQEKSQ